MTRNILFSLTEAAKETGLARSTIFNAIRSGKVSATRDEHNRFVIDPSELFRVYPRVNKKRIENEQKTIQDETKNIREQQNEMDALRKQLELTEQLLSVTRELLKEKEQKLLSMQTDVAKDSRLFRVLKIGD